MIDGAFKKKGASLRSVLAYLLVTVLFLCVLEGVYRTLGYWRNGTFRSLHEYDAELGWRTTANYVSGQVSQFDLLGRKTLRTMRTDSHGSRLWGSRPGAPRLLVLGDSFTQAMEVSNDMTYSAVMARNLDLDVYAYGAGAWGTLQEELMLRRLLPEIRPDALVLQFAVNDFTNNSIELEGQTVLFQQTVRPYLVDGKVVTRFQDWHPYRLALRYSRLFVRLDAMIGVVMYRHYGDFNRLPQGPQRQALERESVSITALLLQRIAASVPAGTRLYTFNRNETDTQTNRAFEDIARAAGFTVIGDLAAHVDARESATETMLAEDGVHFNVQGNELLGIRLAQYLKSQKIGSPGAGQAGR